MRKQLSRFIAVFCVELTIFGVRIPTPISASGPAWPVGLTRSAHAQEALPVINVWPIRYCDDWCGLGQWLSGSLGGGWGNGYSGSGNGDNPWGYLTIPGSLGAPGFTGPAGFVGFGHTTSQAENRGDPDENGVCDPINFATGDQYENETDYTTVENFPLVLARYYNSQDSSGIHSLGYNWRLSYSRSISLYKCGLEWCATVTRDDGRALNFQAVANYTWAGPTYANFSLSQTPSAYTLTTDQDETEVYDGTSLKLLSYTNRAGLTQNMGYDGQGRLHTVTDAFNRTLTYSYNSSSLISQVQAPDGGVYAYGYDSSSRLTSVTYPPAPRANFFTRTPVGHMRSRASSTKTARAIRPMPMIPAGAPPPHSMPTALTSPPSTIAILRVEAEVFRSHCHSAAEIPTPSLPSTAWRNRRQYRGSAPAAPPASPARNTTPTTATPT